MSYMAMAEFEKLFDRVCNWGRWGADDELGTLNLIDPANTQKTLASSVGRSIGLARELSPRYSAANQTPVLHHMISAGAEAGDGAHGMSDWFGLAPHGFGATHVDALNHMAWKQQLYNGVPAASVTVTQGGNHGSVDRLKDGVVTRGVLLDLPASLGIDWLSDGAAAGPNDLEACLASQQVQLRAGDALLIRVGRDAREKVEGPRNYWANIPGLTPECAVWFHDHQISIFGTDGGGDALPSSVEGVGFPLHVLSLVGMGMCMIDNLYLEDLAVESRARGSWEFAFALSVIRLKNATGAPVTPLAIL